MGKMSDRRRKRNKNKKTLAKLLESLKSIKNKFRKPTPPTGYAFKSKKDYNRKNNKMIVKKESDSGE